MNRVLLAVLIFLITVPRIVCVIEGGQRAEHILQLNSLCLAFVIFPLVATGAAIYWDDHIYHFLGGFLALGLTYFAIAGIAPETVRLPFLGVLSGDARAGIILIGALALECAGTALIRCVRKRWDNKTISQDPRYEVKRKPQSSYKPKDGKRRGQQPPDFYC